MDEHAPLIAAESRSAIADSARVCARAFDIYLSDPVKISNQKAWSKSPPSIISDQQDSGVHVPRLAEESKTKTNKSTHLNCALRASSKDVIDHGERSLTFLDTSGSRHVDDHEEWAEEQRARFNMWAANLGVFAIGHASLSHRLRDSSELEDLILQLLNALCANLECCIRVVYEELPSDLIDTAGTGSIFKGGSSAPSPQLSPVYEELDKVSSPSWSPTSSFASLSTDRDSEMTPETIHEAYSEIEAIIDRLNSLSSSIRRFGVHQSDGRAEKFVPRDETAQDLRPAFRSYAQVLVTQRDAKLAEDWLQNRLVDSIVKRWIRLMYRRKHQQKLSRGVGVRGQALTAAETLIEPSNPAVLPEGSAPLRSSSGPGLSSTYPSAIPGPEPLPETKSSSAARSGRVRSSVLGAKLDIPKAPKRETKNNVFECPLCCILCPLRDSTGPRWTEHVLRDLAPYVCTFEDCLQSKHVFRSSDDWIGHMQQDHMPVEWFCLGHTCRTGLYDEAELTFQTKDDYKQHLRREHLSDGTLAETELDAHVQMNSRLSYQIFDTCPFCGGLPDDLGHTGDEVTAQKQRALQIHIGKHLQSLALMSLPWDDSQYEPATSSSRASNHAQLENNALRSTEDENLSSSSGQPNAGALTFSESPERDLHRVDDDLLDYCRDNSSDDPADLHTSPAPDSSEDESDPKLHNWTWMVEERLPYWTRFNSYVGHEDDPNMRPFIKRAQKDVSDHGSVIELPSTLASSSPVIAITGESGSGKSSLISLLTGINIKTGDTLDAVTCDICAYSTSWNGRMFYLIDMLGFGDTSKSDSEVLKEIAWWLSTIYRKKIRLAGILYLHPITAQRFSNSTGRSMETFSKLCGVGNLSSVVVTTTMWEHVQGQDATLTLENAIAREENLAEFFSGYLLTEGSRVERHDGTEESAWRIISSILAEHKTVTLDIQRQLVDEKRSLIETPAGRFLHEKLESERAMYQEELVNLKALPKAANNLSSEQKDILEQEREQLEAAVTRTYEQQEILKIHMQEGLREQECHGKEELGIPEVKDKRKLNEVPGMQRRSQDLLRSGYDFLTS